MLSLAVSGATGRMGGALARLIAESDDLRLVGGIDRAGADPTAAYPRITSPAEAGEVIAEADALLDFSAPAFLSTLLDRHADALAGKALVVGTTGLDDAIEARLDAAAERAAVVQASNFSVGVNLLLALTERVARTLPAERYDIEIVEAHHRHKIDAPSGTALSLGRAAASGRDARLEDARRDGRSGEAGARPEGEIGFHAIRGGEIAGEHRVLFLGARERIELAHVAADRELFAEGALVAARWAAGREPGRFTMRDVLEL